MAVHDSIRPGMQVLGSDGGMIGRATGVHGDHVHLEPTAGAAGAGHTVPLDWIARVDEHVHLNVTAQLARKRWSSGDHGHAAGASPLGARREDAYTGVGKSRIVWIIGAVMLAIVIILLARGCGYAVQDPNYEDDAQGEISDTERELMGPVSSEANETVTAVPAE